jgi:hypothetical protein
MIIPARAKRKETSRRDGGGRLHSQKSSCSGCGKVSVLPANQTKPIHHIAFFIRNKIEREREREREYRSREKEAIAAMDDGF